MSDMLDGPQPITIKEEEFSDADKPPSITPRPSRRWRVAVIANVKGKTALSLDAPPDAGAEFDRLETIQAIQSAIESDGHTAFFLSADSTLPYTLRETNPDLCFNIAEGVSGDAREAQVPALLEMLHIPYTGSRVFTNAVSLDKTMTKHIWRDMGLPTAPFQEFVTGHERLDRHMRFPMFIKPAREGTGMGMDGDSIVRNEDELYRRVSWVIEQYHQPALVEEYLPGREFTVVVMGRHDATRYSRCPQNYDTDGFRRFPVQEIITEHSITPGVYGHHAKKLNFGESGIPDFLCPAPITPELAEQLQNLAIRAHTALNALDFSRVDIRMNAEGEPVLMEINTLPGLTPDFSDLCVITKTAGMSYTDVILEIIYLAASRCGMMEDITTPVYVPDMQTNTVLV
jgi:D-alanine--D-alanine ligase